MITKAEIDLLLNVLNSFLAMLGNLDPALAENKILMDVKSAINSLEALGL